MKDYIEAKDENAERRYIPVDMSVRSDDLGVSYIEGVASVVEQDYDMGWFKERIAKGAFDNVLNDDVVALFNHDPNIPLARTTANENGRLDLFLDQDGSLAYRFRVPKTTAGVDLARNIKNGIISKSSFGFTVETDEWSQNDNEDIPDRRVITKIRTLFDISPVTYAANNSTNVAARSLDKTSSPKIQADELANRYKDLREQLEFLK